MIKNTPPSYGQHGHPQIDQDLYIKSKSDTIADLKRQIKAFANMTLDEFALWQHNQKYGSEK